MLVATRGCRRSSAAGRWPAYVALAVGALLAGVPGLPSSAVRAQGPGRAAGLLVSVPNPITESTVIQIRNRIDGAFKANRGGIKTIICDFNPVPGPARTTNLYVCLELADYLVQQRNRARIVAFVHGEVAGHTVLPVLACNDLIMADGSSIGDVLGDRKMPNDSIKFAYQKYARIKNRESPDLVMKMLDNRMEVKQSRTGHRYMDARAIKEADIGRFKSTDIQSLKPGTTRYTADDAFKVELCKANRNTLREVANEEGLKESSLRQGIVPGAKNAWRISLSGSVSAALVNSARRRMDKAIAKGANLIILQLDCEGGDAQAASDFANQYLRNLKDDRGSNRVETVAYIPPERKVEAASALALACTEIVMGKNSALCSFTLSPEMARKGDDGDEFAMLRKPLVELAVKQGYDALLIQGTLDPNLVIYQVHSDLNPTNHFLISEDDWKQDQARDKPHYVQLRKVKGKGELLKLDAEQAYRYDIARANPKDIEDFAAVCRHYGLDPAKIQEVPSDLLDDLETFFRNPFVRIMLVMLGIIGLILEMKMPGLGVPGVVAAVCFVLYFWASSSVGEFWWLAVLLFVLGLLLIGLEIFFLPGMAVFGISGVVLVVGSLVLVTLDRAPTTSHDWFELGVTLTKYTFSLLAAIVLAFFIARYLPQIPYANRLMLAPPTGETAPLASGGPVGAEAAGALLGAIGEAATTLRPAGKARFGEDFLDVVAEGSYVNAGKRVQVIEIEGNRIVVKEV